MTDRLSSYLGPAQPQTNIGPTGSLFFVDSRPSDFINASVYRVDICTHIFWRDQADAAHLSQ